MKFKSELIEKEFHEVSLILQYMVNLLDEHSKEKTGQEIIVTRVKEKIKGSSGVHEENRAVDVRSEFEGGQLYTEDQVKEMLTFMNSVWPRNDGKVTMIHHSFKGGPKHFHIQLATLTTTYEPAKPKTKSDGE